jgi:UDP-GlcNAc3NAcA epimerase
VKLVSIVGARPQFIKLAPLVRAIGMRNAGGGRHIEHVIVHTGQHRDEAMSERFFAELDLPSAHVNLGVSGGSHAEQTGAMLPCIERALQEQAPDAVLVYGDTNSTAAGALAASKLGNVLVHVEAGLRSFRRGMPEEINRTVADHLADLLLAPTALAARNLEREGLGGRTRVTGDLMLDSVLAFMRSDRGRADAHTRYGLHPGAYALVTVHRAENTDDPERLGSLMRVLNEVSAEEMPLVMPVHPRTAARLREHLPGWRPHPRLHLTDPVGYAQTLRLARDARVVLTDSGGLQKEAFFLGRPCITLREETEWTETVKAGANLLAGADPQRIRAALAHWATKGPGAHPGFADAAADAFGGGQAAANILAALDALAQEHEPTQARREVRATTGASA